MALSDELSKLSAVITVGGMTVVKLVGDVDQTMMYDLEDAAEDAIALGLPVRVDVAQVTFMDSTGIGFIAALVRAGLRPEVVGASRRVVELLTITGLRDAVQLM